ncbi:STY4528 family pathogenicity island replication protein [Pseudomonas sp. UBA2684]|uniref:STY4528 family pathogenicity island replication protein n=1 Tax=Pseudomonas sp. UBA2684 TaxID=1947311 RepID=UPI0025CCF036|nr:STY4528 family pathogenicity island replication protein [Pseudomonas sp. UBA2684]|tara:strand:+ start:27733 stop:29064 length:1332 start_codon:yes stop_codon:yes gene_type:complete
MKLSRFPISTLLDSATGHLEAHLLQKKEKAAAGATSPSSYSGIIFSGNPHETVPRRLLLDDRLTPLERNTWQVFRLLVNEDGITAFPTYDQLRPYLGMHPGKPASRETIAKALTVLRLTRWLSLGRRVRNDLSGQVQGNVYLLHDEPVSPAEALEFDRDYMQLLGQSLEHPNRAIREVAEITWREFASDHDVGRRLPSRMETVEDRLNSQQWAIESNLAALPAPEFGFRTQPDITPSALSSESELSDNSANQGTLALSSESELSQKSQSSALVRNPNSYSTYTNTHHDVCKSSVPRAERDVMARWLLGLERLPSEQKLKAVSAMQRVPTELRPAVIEQWLHRCDAGGVRNPLGYLLSCVQRAIRGEFNVDWRPYTSPPPADPTPGAVAVAGPPIHPPARSGTASAAAAAAAAARTPDTVRTAREQLNAMQHLLRPRLVGTSQT